MKKWHGNEWAILLTLSLGFFMTLLDLTIVNIAIPNMIDKLHAGLDQILWVINGYALVLAALLITGGRLVTAFDWRWIFFVNVPIGAVVLALSFILIPDMRPGRRHRLDVVGVLL